MTTDQSVTATFTLVPESLTVTSTGDGAGTVTSRPAGIDCGAGCTHDYDYGTSVALRAGAAKGSSFAGWDGDCRGKSSCLITMTDAHSVEAAFVKDCTVPKLTGKRLKSAKRTLKAHDCSAGKTAHAFSKIVKKGRVISQKPKARKLLRHGAKVNVIVSKGKQH